LREIRTVEPDIPVEQLRDGYGNIVWRLVAPAGALRVRYDALVAVPAPPDPVLPDLQKTPIEKLPGDVLSYIWPTRYCPSDLLIDDAWRLFGHVQGGWAQVQAVCDWMHANITYGTGSTSATDSLEVYQKRRGVCRDFAHLAVTFCRALNIPARYVCGYLPDIGVEPPPTPMDFHAWFQVYLDGAWRTFDARHNQPRIGRAIIATGRDAVDGAWATVFGSARLVQLLVWADEVDAGFTLDDLAAESQAKV
jgi:transglutaminase-like putative cysteine protease